MKENFKPQTSNSKKTANSKFQLAWGTIGHRRFVRWDLNFVLDLGFGIWDF